MNLLSLANNLQALFENTNIFLKKNISIPNAYSYKFFQCHKSNKNDINLLFIGRLVKIKGLEYLFNSVI
jgi:hypothetical protein